MSTWYKDTQPDIPEKLYHHTSLGSVELILRNDRYLSLLLGPNLKKNDDNELVLGKHLYTAILKHMDANKQHGLLHQVESLDSSVSVHFSALPN